MLLIKKKTVLAILLTSSFLFGFFSIGLFLYTSFLSLNEPFYFNWVEGTSLFFSKKVLLKQSLYPNLETIPIIINVYPPLYYFISAFLLIFFGHSLIGLRILSIISEIIISLIVYKIINKEANNKIVSIIFALVTIITFSIHKFHALARNDMFTFVLIISAIYFLVSYLKEKRKTYLIYYCLLFVIAQLSKQTSIITLGIFTFYSIILLAGRTRKKSGGDILKYSLLSLFISSLISLSINFMTENQFLKHIYFYEFLSYVNFDNAFLYTTEIFKMYWPIIVISIFILIQKGVPTFYKLFFVGETMWYFLAILKEGGDLNYTIEPLVSGIILAGIWFGKSIYKTGAYYFLSLFLVIISINSTAQGFYYKDLVSSPAKEERQKIAELVKKSEGLILTEDPFFSSLYDKEILTNNAYHTSLLIKRGIIDPNLFIDPIRKKQVQWIFTGPFVERIPEVEEVIKSREYLKIYETKTKIIYSKWKVFKKTNLN